MTIEYRKGNLLDVTEGIIVHGCNAVGVMGSGVAKAIKDKYPGAYNTYKDDIDNGNYGVGDVSWWNKDYDFGLIIASAITQEYYGRDPLVRYVNYVALSKCFDEIMGNAEYQNSVVYFPKIGAGLGGGDWNIIEQLIIDADPYNKVKKVCYEL